MKRSLSTILFFGLLAIAAMQAVACAPARPVYAVEQPAAGAAPTTSDPEAPVVVAAPSCARPTPDLIPACDEAARRILASTVRLEFHGPSGGIGHATVIGGRYLVTHNHYPVTAATLNSGGEGLVTAVSVYKANGDIILLKAPLSYLTVVVEEPEMLVLDFNVYSGTGFFDSLGVPSAEYNRGDSLNLIAGSEVAQIDWDGTTAHVEWAQVVMVPVGDRPARLEIDNYVEQGASGGGVFYQGVHIANNWTRQTDRLESGEIVRQYSVVAMNTTDVLAIAKN